MEKKYKLRIINHLVDKGFLLDNLSDMMTCDILITIYHIGKLVEGGFITHQSFTMTVKGFDTAIDLVDAGYKITMDEAMAACSGLFM